MTGVAWPLKRAASGDGSARIGLLVVLVVAAAARAWVVATHTYVLWPDETFQYLEPAHRLVFGSGVTTWEFLDGIRSWLLPGVIAGVMWLVSLVWPGPDAYLLVIRSLCAAFSLAVPFVGFRLVLPRCGLAPAMLAGLLCALGPETVYFAPVIMAEPLAAEAALLAIWLGDAPAGTAPPRPWRLVASGLLFGLSCSLRYQYAPVLAFAALMQHGRSLRRLSLVAGAGGAVVVAVLGGLDAATWGSPFQSVWLNFYRNALQGVSVAMGTEAPLYYCDYFILAWGVAAPVLLAGAVLGGRRLPVLAAVALCTIGLHSLTPHKEMRFVFLATACLPMLIGAGLGSLLGRVARLRAATMGVPVAALIALVIAASTHMAVYHRASQPDAWHRDRSAVQATLAARTMPGACGLGIRTVWVYRSGGYTYWDRDLPIYYETWDEAQVLARSPIPLRLRSEVAGRPVPQFGGAALVAASDRFNVMIGTPADVLPGFAQRGCYGIGTVDDPTYCVFTRPGGCA